MQSFVMLLNRCSVTNEINALLSDQSELWKLWRSSNIDFLLKLTYVNSFLIHCSKSLTCCVQSVTRLSLKLTRFNIGFNGIRF